PFDLKGVGALGNRYISPDKQDDSWLYLPSLRRVRRLSTAQRSDALFGQDTDVDSYYGYAGQVGWMDWKYLGERDILGIVHAQHYPVKWHDKVDWAMDEVWEKRHVYALEGISKLPQYAYGKRVLFIDKETWGIPYSDIYDRSGELWKIWINDVGFRKKAFDGGARADVVPGDKITDQNMDKVKDLISPGMEWCIKRGFPMTIVAPRRIEWPRAYKEATEKYSAQVKLAPDGLSVQNFIAGQPFPDLDPKDPQIALKVMWDYEYKFNPTDDLDLRNFDADTGAVADHGPMSIERHFLLDHLRSQFWTGRLYVDPKPEKPNPNGYRSQLGLYPVLE